MLAICLLIHRPTSIIKPRSHCPGSTPMKTSQVYSAINRGIVLTKIRHVLTVTVLSRCNPGLVPSSTMVLSRCMPVCPDFTTVIALSHIYAPAAYRSCIYENFDTPRSEAYFVQATYVPRTSYVTATFTWRVSDVAYLYLYEISLSYVRRIKTYVLRTCVVCMAYEVYA